MNIQSFNQGKTKVPNVPVKMSQDKVEVSFLFMISGSPRTYDGKGFLVQEKLSFFRRLFVLKPRSVVKAAIGEYYLPFSVYTPIDKVMVNVKVTEEGKNQSKTINYEFQKVKILSVTSDLAVSSVATFGLTLTTFVVEFSGIKILPE